MDDHALSDQQRRYRVEDREGRMPARQLSLRVRQGDLAWDHLVLAAQMGHKEAQVAAGRIDLLYGRDSLPEILRRHPRAGWLCARTASLNLTQLEGQDWIETPGAQALHKCLYLHGHQGRCLRWHYEHLFQAVGVNRYCPSRLPCLCGKCAPALDWEAELLLDHYRNCIAGAIRCGHGEQKREAAERLCMDLDLRFLWRSARYILGEESVWVFNSF